MPMISTNFLVPTELFSTASPCSLSSFILALEGKDTYFSLWWSSFRLRRETAAKNTVQDLTTQQRIVGRSGVLMAKHRAEEASCCEENDCLGALRATHATGLLTAAS